LAGSSLLTLLDDIATLLDDISVMGKLAAKKPQACWEMIYRLTPSR
jgi:predicted DNA repair protein MutK